MSQPKKKINNKRTVYAPQSANQHIPFAIFSVELSNDEEVEWHWTHFSNGQSAIARYKIIKYE